LTRGTSIITFGTMAELGKGAKADTPGCTTQACSIRDAMPDLKRLGIAAVGISPDEPKAQKKVTHRRGGKILQAWYKVSPADTVPLAKEALAAK
jgi:hypothetical protein